MDDVKSFEIEDSVERYLFVGVMNGCGCGNSDDIAKEVLALFEAIALEGNDTFKKIYANHYSELIAHWFDSIGLVEHGYTIGGSFLSSKGKAVWAEIQRGREAASNGGCP